MYTRILVATDGSESAAAAVRHAARAAAALASERLGIVHVLPNPATLFAGAAAVEGYWSDDVYEVMQREADRLLQEAREMAAAAYGGAVEIHLKTGSIAEEVRALVREEGYDLLVVGSRGLGRVERFLLGSVSSRLVQTAPCSVLVVKDTGAGDDPGA